MQESYHLFPSTASTASTTSVAALASLAGSSGNFVENGGNGGGGGGGILPPHYPPNTRCDNFDIFVSKIFFLDVFPFTTPEKIQKWLGSFDWLCIRISGCASKLISTLTFDDGYILRIKVGMYWEKIQKDLNDFQHLKFTLKL